MPPEDIDDKNEIPQLAEMLFKIYGNDAHLFMIDVIQKTIEFLPQLYPTAGQTEKEKQIQVLELETIVKFCQYAENLAALALAFVITYKNPKEEKIGVFKKISDYDLLHVVHFYTHIATRDVKYIAKFIGYPPLDLQNKTSRNILEMSCNVIKEKMSEIGKLYIEFRSVYNAYKHGYRLFFGKDDQTSEHVIAYFERTGKQKFVRVTNNTIKKIRSSARQCRNIIHIMMECHNERIKHEESGGIKGAQVNISRLRKADQPPLSGNLTLNYPKRGDKRKKEIEEGNIVYDALKEDLEKNHMGKIVAIDIDEKKIIALDDHISKVTEAIKEKGHSGRLHIRRVGKNDKTGIEIY